MPDDLVTGIPTITGVQSFTVNEIFQSQLEIYSGEIQQIIQQPAHNTILGGRAQYGHIQTVNVQGTISTVAPIFEPPPPDPLRDAADQDITSLFKRFSLYAYHQWELTDWLELIGGLTYDRITFPENFRTAPISAQEKTVDGFLPKAGLILRPLPDTTLRFAYTRSLAGASIDQSFQLEPSQVAGFVQSFRSIIPESIVGANAGARFETYGLSLEQKFHSGTYLGVTGEILNSEFGRTLGAFDSLPDEEDFPVPSGLRQHLNYREPSLLVTANQLVGNNWSFGARYRLSQAVLKDNFPGVPTDIVPGNFIDFEPNQRVEAVLNQVTLSGIFNHPCGFFGEGDAVWYSQNNIGYHGTEPGDDFWQFNLFAGYRFPRRRAVISVGILNLTDQNYRLNPLNLYNELPRERTLMARFQINF
jgi:outer membrane receptor protein involved in Fe transport